MGVFGEPPGGKIERGNFPTPDGPGDRPGIEGKGREEEKEKKKKREEKKVEARRLP
jgi:hypothetical protein